LNAVTAMDTTLADEASERTYRLGAVAPREVDEAMADRRSTQREPQYKLAGFVWAGDPCTALACTVRDLSETGARIELDYQGFRPSRSPIELPTELVLHLCPRQAEIDCRLVWQDGRHFGVIFVGEARPSTRRFV
jgi:hypothetical protein